MKNAGTVECLALNPTIDVASECAAVHPTHKIRLEKQSVYPGGGAVNVARVIRLLGGTSSLICTKGGATGEILKSRITDLEIPCHYIKSNTNTRIAFTVFDRAVQNEYRFLPKGDALSDSDYKALLNQVTKISTDGVVLSGSLPQKAPTDIYARIACETHDRGVRVFLDCAGEALSSTLASKCVFLVKPSFLELEQLAGKKLTVNSAIDFASTLVANGSAQHVAVSMGDRGAFLVNKEGLLQASAIKVKAQSAVGAGDSFLAAMVFKVMQNDSIESALEWGIAAGAAAVMTKGTKLCELHDFKSLLHQVSLVKN